MNAVPSGEQTSASSLVPATQGNQSANHHGAVKAMCETAGIVLLAFWLLGIGIDYTANGYIHLLLAAALICGAIRFRRRGSMLSV